jgi:predicted DNA-binding transcriptional regulator AlpA
MTGVSWSRTVKPVTLGELRAAGPVVNVEIAAAALGVSRSAAYEAIARDEFPARIIHVGRRIKVVTASLIDLLDTGAAGSTA